jgi:hypothetical protein
MRLLHEVSLIVKELSKQQVLLPNQRLAAIVPSTEVCIEPESHIVPKLLRRATSKPVTICKFFSSLSSLKDTNSQTFRENQENHTMKGSTTRDQTSKQLTGVSNSVSRGNPVSVDRKRSRITDSNTVGQTISQAFQRGAKRGATHCAIADSCINKYPSQEIQCPVCQNTLKQPISNADFNRHVDDCLKQASSTASLSSTLRTL